jgi:hypothetical protein
LQARILVKRMKSLEVIADAAKTKLFDPQRSLVLELGAL